MGLEFLGTRCLSEWECHKQIDACIWAIETRIIHMEAFWDHADYQDPEGEITNAGEALSEPLASRIKQEVNNNRT